jgi:hypothetical protein
VVVKVLMVITSHDQLGNTGRKTGFWLEELAAPLYVFKDAGAAHNKGLGESWNLRRLFWKDRALHEESLRTSLLSLAAARIRALVAEQQRSDSLGEFSLSHARQPGEKRHAARTTGTHCGGSLIDRVRIDVSSDYNGHLTPFARRCSI